MNWTHHVRGFSPESWIRKHEGMRKGNCETDTASQFSSPQTPGKQTQCLIGELLVAGRQEAQPVYALCYKKLLFILPPVQNAKRNFRESKATLSSENKKKVIIVYGLAGAEKRLFQELFQ